MEPSFVQLGVAGAVCVVLLYILKLIVDGKLRTKAEVDGLRQDKRDLLTINTGLTKALGETNQLLAKVVVLLQDVADRTEDADGTPNG